jgi:hypothetical protein
VLGHGGPLGGGLETVFENQQSEELKENTVNTPISLAGSVLVALGLPSLAWADDHPPSPQSAQTSAGIGLSAGAGLTGFSDGAMRDVTDVGLAWDARLTLGTRSMLALEAAYVGSAQGVDLMVEDVTLIGHGAEAAGRLNLGTLPVQPYVVAGLGWTRYKVYYDDTPLNVSTDDDILTVPLGAGVGFHLAGVLIDVRGSYRFAFDDELFRDEADFEERPAFDNWAVTARAGVEL